jgi:hypothetical protein
MYMNLLARHLAAMLLLGAAFPVFSQTAAAPPANPPAQQRKPMPPARVPEELAAFFSGDWSGKGAFASGRPIEADVRFSSELDGQWLLYRHADRVPNSYKALGMWGIESATRKLVMTINDNGGSARTFVSDGWVDGRVVFVRPISSEPVREERFVFERRSADSFHMAYEVRQGEQPWRMIDQLSFERVKQ